MISTHTTRDGKVIPIIAMEDSHVIAMIEEAVIEEKDEDAFEY
jgi:hypothetical protein